ncbi:MAG: hypothetical protein EOM73_11585, partial [Bacteroidia bacterium]|nr:hypothetical protein [Bacteroidia bacterium]
MTILAIILFIILGLLLLLIEFAVIPGVTIAGIGGILLLIASIYIAFTSYGTGAGIVTLIFVMLAAPALVYYLFKSRAGKKMILESQIDSKVETFDNLKIAVGDTG